MTTLNTYLPKCNGMQVNNKKKLETSFQVKCKTTANRECGDEGKSAEKEQRDGIGIQGCAVENWSLSTASSPSMSGRATVLGPANSRSGNRSPPSSSVTLTQTSWPWISPLQPLLWQKP